MRTSKLVSFLAVVLALSSFRASADDVKWIGGATGRWADSANWDLKKVPDEDDHARFLKGTTCVVDLEGEEVKVSNFYVGIEQDGNLEESPVVLTGGGKLTTKGISYVYDNRKLVLDGVDADFGGSQFGIREGAQLLLRNGVVVETTSTFKVGTNAVFDVGSCTARGKLDMADGALFRMREGGSQTMNKGPTITDGTPKFDVTGGRIVSIADNLTQANLVASFAADTLGGAVELEVVETNGTRTILRRYSDATSTSVFAGDDTSVEISAEGAKSFQVASIPAAPLIARSISVGERATADLTTAKDAAVYSLFRHLSFGACSTNFFTRLANNSKYDNWFIATESSAVGPSVIFKVSIDRAPMSGTTYPLLVGAAEGSVLSSEQFELVPGTEVDLTGWEVKCIGPFAYLTDDKYTPATKEDCWIGGTSGNWNDAENWIAGTGSAKFFSGEKNTVVTNDIAGGTTVKGLRFEANCAPFVFRGNQIVFNKGGLNIGSGGSLYAASKYPVVFELPVSLSQAGAFTVAADAAGSSFAFMGGGVNLAGKGLKMRGDVMIGSTATMGTLEFAEPAAAARGTALHVLSNGNVTVSAQADEIATAASIFVAKGGVMTYAGGAFTYGTVENVHAVDGLLDIQCPFSGTCGITFLGEGTVKLAQVVAPAEGTSVVTLKGGITLEPGSWETEAVSLAVAENGTASIKVDEAFTLNCALTSGVRSHLRKTGAGTLNFSKAYVFPGEFKVVEGTIGVTGDLAAAAEEGLVDVLTAKELTGDIAVPDGYRFKLAANSDGSTTLKVAKKHGLMLILR